MAKRTTTKPSKKPAAKKPTSSAPKPVRLVEEIEWTDEDEAAANRAMAELYGVTPPTSATEQKPPASTEPR